MHKGEIKYEKSLIFASNMNFFAEIRLKNMIICCDLHLFTATAAKESKRVLL